MNNAVRSFVFMVLFGLGVGALSLASLLDDIDTYYQQRRLLVEADRNLATLSQLNTDYDGLLKQIETDPTARKRLIPVVLGQRPQEPNAVFPEAALAVLMQAKQATASQRERTPLPQAPPWLARLQEPQRRKGLFAAGGGLVLVAILWFGRERKRQVEGVG